MLLLPMTTKLAHDHSSQNVHVLKIRMLTLKKLMKIVILKYFVGNVIILKFTIL